MEIRSETLAETYEDLISEAFITPIRNVAVIDDEYPTLTAFLNDTISEKQNKVVNKVSLQQILSMCHDDHKWSLDVYDGKKPILGLEEENNNDHINHCDLIILDYHLDGEPDSDTGERARNIINHLANNNHFNLVIIHTKGHESGIQQVFSDILKEFISFADLGVDIDGKTKDTVDLFLDEEDPDGTTFPAFNQNYSFVDILKQIRQAKPFNIKNSTHLFKNAKDDIEKIAEGSNVKPTDITKYKFNQILTEEYRNIKSKESINTRWEFDSNVNFISSGRIFLTVVLKTAEGSADVLFNKLLKALHCFDASPMMLLMTKMRSEIDDRGLEFATEIIENRYAQAGWLYNLLEKTKENILEHSHAIDLHWEQLAAASQEHLVCFSKRLVNSLQHSGKSSKEITKRYFKDCIDQQILSTAHLNVYSCSRPPTTSHLTTGTILKCTQNKYWICLSPACDLVPDQATERWKDRLGNDHIAFQTIQLINDGTKLSTALEKVNDNEYIFLKINDEIEHFRFSRFKNPLWETFYAANRGKFTLDESGHDYIEVKTFRNSGNGLESVDLKMEVVSELRYEYALNLLHKFGSNQTRVGLNFVKGLW